MATGDVIQKDLGLVTAYGYALAGGYTGSEEQFIIDFAALMNGGGGGGGGATLTKEIISLSADLFGGGSGDTCEFKSGTLTRYGSLSHLDIAATVKYAFDITSVAGGTIFGTANGIDGTLLSKLSPYSGYVVTGYHDKYYESTKLYMRTATPLDIRLHTSSSSMSIGVGGFMGDEYRFSVGETIYIDAQFISKYNESGGVAPIDYEELDVSDYFESDLGTINARLFRAGRMSFISFELISDIGTNIPVGDSKLLLNMKAVDDAESDIVKKISSVSHEYYHGSNLRRIMPFATNQSYAWFTSGCMIQAEQRLLRDVNRQVYDYGAPCVYIYRITDGKYPQDTVYPSFDASIQFINRYEGQ